MQAFREGNERKAQKQLVGRQKKRLEKNLKKFEKSLDKEECI